MSQDKFVQAYRQSLKAHCLKVLCREKARDYGYMALFSSIFANPQRERFAFDTMSILNLLEEKLDGIERNVIASV